MQKSSSGIWKISCRVQVRNQTNGTAVSVASWCNGVVLLDLLLPIFSKLFESFWNLPREAGISSSPLIQMKLFFWKEIFFFFYENAWTFLVYTVISTFVRFLSAWLSEDHSEMKSPNKPIFFIDITFTPGFNTDNARLTSEIIWTHWSSPDDKIYNL